MNFNMQAFTLILQFSASFASLRIFKAYQNPQFTNQESSYQVLDTVTARSKLYCAALCLRTSNCLSYFYNKDVKSCRLHSIALSSNADTHNSVQNGWMYYMAYTDQCPVVDNYIHNEALNVCTKVHSIGKSYSDAVMSCNNEREELVRIDSADKQNQIALNVGAFTGNDYYVQGYKDVTGTWRYDDGALFTYLNWDTARGQPDSTDKYLDIWRQASFTWHGVSGNSMFHYICQKHLRT